MQMTRTLSLLLLSATLALAACSKATAENYAKVQSGMKQTEVHKILGAPDETTGGTLGGLTLSSEKWKSGKDIITITYTGERVAVKSIEPATKE